MKKLSIILLLIFVYATKFLPTEEESAYKTLDNHFKRHFKEEFEIKYFSKRKMGSDFWYEAEVYPKRFIGTAKEYDSYYHGQGFVGKNKQPGDTYGGVILNEGANEYYRPKLEELFGKNVLPVLTVKGSYNDRVPSFEKEKENGVLTSLEGGIYIFGRVENELDREKYRESIYKFIQYLKETNSFDYSDINLFIRDERTLLKKESQEILANLNFKGLKYNEIDELINKSLNPLNEKYNQLTLDQKQEILNSTNKSNPFKGEKGFLLLVKIASPKYVDNFFRQDLIKEIFDGKKEYNTIKDVKFKGDEF